ncbi:MAG: hypothetical protein AB1758_00750 [Candidatus Eremiobacterota bacterium]
MASSPAAQVSEVVQGLRSGALDPAAALARIEALESDLQGWLERLHGLAPEGAQEEGALWLDFEAALTGYLECLESLRELVGSEHPQEGELTALTEEAREHERRLEAVQASYEELLDRLLEGDT